MIQIYKSPDSPRSLEAQNKYSTQEVQRQLLKDQHKKCYLCERILVTDFQVEHLHSQSDFPEEKSVWSNLLLACSYCNGKKGDRYNHILNPINSPVEEMILQKVDYEKNVAIFDRVESHNSEGLEGTITLLSSILNGIARSRSVREESFYDYFMSRITLFTKACNSYLDSSTEQNRQLVSCFLQSDMEFLGFKYWIIRSNERLWEAFRNECQWYRRK